jgi:hypothetical protein
MITGIVASEEDSQTYKNEKHPFHNSFSGVIANNRPSVITGFIG